MLDELPDPFLQSLFPPVTAWDPVALCAGFDGGEWRCVPLARHLTEWIVEFSLRRFERDLISKGNIVAMVREAAARVFDKDAVSRGEAGEILLHAACRQEFGTRQLVARLFYKSSLDEQMHGFDCVHFRENDQGSIELWLGEAKLYASRDGALTAARSSIKEHLDRGFLTAQKLLILPKLEEEGEEFAAKVRHLFHRNTPVDEFLQAMVVPVLIATDSDAVKNARSSSASYRLQVKSELADVSSKLKKGKPFADIKIQPIYVPVQSKEALRKSFGDVLKGLK